MADLNQNIKFNSNIEKLIEAVTRLDTRTIKAAKSAANIGKTFGQTVTSIKKQLSTVKPSSFIQNANLATQGLGALTVPANTFNRSLQDISAIAGITGGKLQEIGGYARQNAKEFGTSAAQGVESYKLILSQLGPDIANTPAALREMGTLVSVTSKLMGGDATSAAEVLTTAMNQYQVSLADPIAASKDMKTMLNVMAAAAKEGRAELSAIKMALETSGMAAKTAGVSFEELNATIQVLDKAGKKGAEGGMAVRNVLDILSQGRFTVGETATELEAAGIKMEQLGDTSLTLTERLRPLQSVMGNQALLTKMFGMENSNAALAVLSNLDNIDKLKGKIEGTNTAFEQVDIIMASQIEKNNQLKAQVDDFKISLFNASSSLIGYASVFADMGRDVSYLGSLIQPLGIKLLKWIKRTRLAAAAQWLWNAALNANPIGRIVMVVAALVAGVVLAYQKVDWFRGSVKGAWEGLKQFAIIIKDHVLATFKKLVGGISGIGKAFKHLFSGEWEQAWESGKEAMGALGSAVLGMTPIGMGVAVYNNANKIGKAVRKGYAEGVNDLAKQPTEDTKPTTATTNPTNAFIGPLPQGARPAVPNLLDSFQPPTKDPSTSTAESIVTGGRKQTILTVNIDRVIGDVRQEVYDTVDAADDLVDKVIEGLTRRIHSTVRGVSS